MTEPLSANLQLIYVSSIERSRAFYERLFKTQPIFTSPRYVAFSAGQGAFFAIWSGGEHPDRETPRFSEVGILLGSNEGVDALFEEWKSDPDIEVVKEPYTDVFGRTFLVKDPDGHLIRVSPLD